MKKSTLALTVLLTALVSAPMIAVANTDVTPTAPQDGSANDPSINKDSTDTNNTNNSNTTPNTDGSVPDTSTTPSDSSTEE